MEGRSFEGGAHLIFRVKRGALFRAYLEYVLRHRTINTSPQNMPVRELWHSQELWNAPVTILVTSSTSRQKMLIREETNTT